MEELGLFPLGLVLLPSEQVPLHIFEERYKELIGECIDGGTEFGLVYATDEGIGEVGTRATVAEVLTRFEDGRLNVLVEGGGRFKLEQLTEGRSFQTGLVSPIDDEMDPADSRAIDEALRLFGLLRELTSSEVDTPDKETPQLSFSLAGRVELPVEAKLALLVEVSERRRMDQVQDLFEAAVLTAQRVRRAGERAATNGRVELG